MPMSMPRKRWMKSRAWMCGKEACPAVLRMVFTKLEVPFALSVPLVFRFRLGMFPWRNPALSESIMKAMVRGADEVTWGRSSSVAWEEGGTGTGREGGKRKEESVAGEMDVIYRQAVRDEAKL